MKSKPPAHILAALEALQLQSPSTARLELLSPLDQQRFFEWCDSRQISLLLPYICSSAPDWVIEGAISRASRYDTRFERIKRKLYEIADAFDRAGLPFVMLKGLSHSPALTPHAALRAQGDIDLWLPGDSAYKGWNILAGLGYVPVVKSESRHLPPLTRISNWKWRGDLFDPDMPISVELHHELWSEAAEHIPAPGLEQFWHRAELRDFDGHLIKVLCDQDLIAFAALHLLLHLLHGELPLQRAWELARFLDTHADDGAFWHSWRNFHPLALRQLQVCMFHLLIRWFNTKGWNNFHNELQALPPMIRNWLRTYSFAPIEREWKANKSELWLHLSLICEWRKQLSVFLRRLLPLALPLFTDQARPATSKASRIAAVIRQLPMLFSRLLRHTRTFLPTLLGGVRWTVTQRSAIRCERNAMDRAISDSLR